MNCPRFLGLVILFVLAFTFYSQGQGNAVVSDFQCLGKDTFAAGLNDAGQLVGWYGGSPDNPFLGAQSFVKKRGQSCESLPAAPNAAATIALGINDPGQIVGIAFTADRPNGTAFLYEKGNYTLFDYGSAGSNLGQTCQTWAFSINNSGQIVGLYDVWTLKGEQQVCGGPDYPFLREADGKLVTLARDPSWTDSSQANGINPRGMVIGNYLNGDREDGYLRLADGKLVFPIHPQGASDTMPTGINSQGQVVGRYFTQSWLGPVGPCHGFFLDSKDSTPIEIKYPDAEYTCVGAINAPGEVSGAWAPNPNGPWRSFVLDVKVLIEAAQ